MLEILTFFAVESFRAAVTGYLTASIGEWMSGESMDRGDVVQMASIATVIVLIIIAFGRSDLLLGQWFVLAATVWCGFFAGLKLHVFMPFRKLFRRG